MLLVFFKKQTDDSDIYILTDTVFKLSVALYLFIFFMIYSFPGLEYEDTIILRFSGAVLLYDINYSGLLAIMRKHIPGIPKVPYLE